MSARRAYIDGHPVWLKENDGAVGRISYSRRGISGGSGTVVYGQLATGESHYSGKLEKRTGAHSPKVRP